MKNKGLIFTNIILIILVLGLGSYLVYDKVIDKNETDNPKLEETDSNKTDNDEVKEPEFDKKDASYFNEYLYYFMPSKSASNFVKTINSFSEEDIQKYLLFYYMNLARDNKITVDDSELGKYKYNVSKKEIAEIVYKYFGIRDFKITNNSQGRMGIASLDNDNYQVYWFATEWMAPDMEITSVNYDEKNVTVECRIYNVGEMKLRENSTLKFYLVYNDGNYNVKSIEYIG